LPEIHARTETPVVSLHQWRARSLWSARYALAAAAVLLIVVTSLLTRVVTQRAHNEVAASAGADSVRFGANAQTVLDTAARAPQLRATLVAREDADYAALEAQYVAATGDLMRLLQTQKTRMSPETARLLERNVQLIDRAINETRAALAQDPHDADLRALVRTSYERKLELLRNVAELSL
jgi:hypothetical protein